jgi:hypothetical protein
MWLKNGSSSCLLRLNEIYISASTHQEVSSLNFLRNSFKKANGGI